MIDGGVEKTYSTFEKIIYIFVIPIVFTIILALALFSLFDYNVKDTLLKYGRDIPYVGQYLPKPATEIEKEKKAEMKIDEFGADYTKEFKKLNDKIVAQESELNKAVTDNQTKDQLIKELQAELSIKEEQLKAKSLSDEEYLKKIQELASVYGNMSASKAAPIIENLTTREAVLVLNQMTVTDKKNILQKMNPERAAEISILSKDVVPTKDQTIAALQSRLKLQDPNADTKTRVNRPDLADTYATMEPKNAAVVLSELYKTNTERVYSILSNMDTAKRAPIIEEMDPILAATITNRISE
jgi:flagellar motility protein MotE (MotC chaperone)